MMAAIFHGAFLAVAAGVTVEQSCYPTESLPSAFEGHCLSNIAGYNEAVQKLKETKKDVLAVLKDLSEQSEGLVIEKIEDEITGIKEKMVGHGLVIAGGIAGTAICLLQPAGWVAIASTGGSAISYVVGYLLVGDSMMFKMKISEKHSAKLKGIAKKVEVEVKHYKESQKKVYSDLENVSNFDSGEGFVENLKRIRAIVDTAEAQTNVDLSSIEEVLLRLRKTYNSLPDVKKRILDTKPFRDCLSFLTKDDSGNLDHVTGPATVDTAAELKAAAAATAAPPVAAGATADTAAASSISWWGIFHGVNILINGVILVDDFYEYRNLREMRKTWYEDRGELMKNPRFKGEVSLRDEINKIRDQISGDGFYI